MIDRYDSRQTFLLSKSCSGRLPVSFQNLENLFRGLLLWGRYLTILFLWLGLFAEGTLLAQDNSGQESSGDPIQEKKELLLGSPQKTIGTFLKSRNKKGGLTEAESYWCLELGTVPDIETYAYKLKYVLDRVSRIAVDQFPSESDFADEVVLADYLEIGDSVVDPNHNQARESVAKQLTLVRGADKYWRFSAESLEELVKDGGIYDRVTQEGWQRIQDLSSSEAQEASAKPWATWIEEQFPKALSQKHFVLRDYQWICLAIFVFLGFVADLATRTILNGLTTFWIRKVRAKIDYKVQKELWKPVGLLSQSLVWYGGTSLLALPSWILLILVVAVKFLTVVAAVWTAFRLIDLLANFLENKADKTETKFDNLLVHLLSRSLRIVAVCIGLVMFADIFELPWTGLLGGLGIGGAAIAFASKDVLGNFFGSLTVLSDRPFEIGDWVIMGDVEGSVETVGIRSTRIRTFYNSLIVVPNSTLVTATVDNMGQRRFRRVKAKLSLTYDTSPEKIDAFCEGVRELLRRHPYTRKDYYHVYLNELGESGLQILLYSFWECPDWSIELREKHRLYLDIIRLASKLGVEFAFPTSTLHLHQTENEAPRSALDLSDPQLTGKKAAAEITGPPMTGNARPGPVLFEGPADFPSS